jgi:propionyl-CoA carboxylase alpha chain
MGEGVICCGVSKVSALMFKKILIANRGEIACRIMRTAKRMGIKTVAVYSEADKNLPHVEMADEAALIGPPAAAESYLALSRIVAAAQSASADAVHPGYGFLAENAAFAQALGDAGITFIGPHARAIALMGDKIEAKKLARAANVTTVPGFLGEIDDADHARDVAEQIGFPIMVKAAAGGGGKGMRIVEDVKDLPQAISSAANEARAAFGDARIFIEKFIVDPRHIEIQVLGDRHGHVIHLGERECSIQRRHQKVIEEAPSPLLDKKTREAMGAQAVALAKAAGYDSAGTVEFIADQRRNFYFMEMNTRLQVEHPVTELVTGIDLVEQMIRVAAGEKLALRQDKARLEGAAVEARLYAEDPTRGFLPSVGRIVRYRPPKPAAKEGVRLRLDTGVEEGSEISIHYDPMIAKLCTHAATREEALEAMADALDGFVIEGIRHNAPFLSALMCHPRLRSGRLSTGFVSEEFPEGFHGAVLDEEQRERLVAVAAAAAIILGERRASAKAPHVVVSLGGRDYSLTYTHVDRRRREMEIAIARTHEERRSVVLTSQWWPGEPVFHGIVDGKPMSVQIKRIVDGFLLSHRGATEEAFVRGPRAAELAKLMPKKRPPDTSKYLLSPMPGLVVSIEVKEGQEVKAGETLAIVEAMKMENVLKAERDGVVTKIAAKKGDTLGVDQVILEFK